MCEWDVVVVLFVGLLVCRFVGLFFLFLMTADFKGRYITMVETSTNVRIIVPLMRHFGTLEKGKIVPFVRI